MSKLFQQQKSSQGVVMKVTISAETKRDGFAFAARTENGAATVITSLALSGVSRRLRRRFSSLTQLACCTLMSAAAVMAVDVTAKIASAAPLQWTVESGGNGHYYDVIELHSLPWSTAKLAAEQLTFGDVRGHLLTVTSQAELDFVQHNLPLSEFHWLGGYQDFSAPDYSEPSGGWRWVTGESFEFQFWSTRGNGGDVDEPNNHEGIEHSLSTELGVFDEIPQLRANDLPDGDDWMLIRGYYVEYSEMPLVLGDTNADGDVDLSDLNNVRNNFSGSGLGDTSPFDGDVDLDDLNEVRNNFGAGGSNPVPEPSSLVLLAVGTVGFLTRRWMAFG